MSTQRRMREAPRVGRRPGGPNTRALVLAAARIRFAAEGFGGTTIRAVATDAGVDPSLVMQFFGSKAGLFAAVMEIPDSALRRFDSAFEGADDHLGQRVARAFLEAWEAPNGESAPLMAMLRGAIVNEYAREQLRDFIQARLDRGARGADEQDRALRAGLVAAMLMGIVTSRQIIEVPSLAEADCEALVAAVAPGIQAVLTGSRP